MGTADGNGLGAGATVAAGEADSALSADGGDGKNGVTPGMDGTVVLVGSSSSRESYDATGGDGCFTAGGFGIITANGAVASIGSAAALSNLFSISSISLPREFDNGAPAGADAGTALARTDADGIFPPMIGCDDEAALGNREELNSAPISELSPLSVGVGGDQAGGGGGLSADTVFAASPNISF